MQIAHAGVSFPEAASASQASPSPAVADGGAEGGKVLALTPWWQSPGLLADKQGLTGEARASFDALSHDSQQALAWHSLTTGRSMQELLQENR